MKPETVFRINSVVPFLKTLKNTFYQPIQQLAFVGSPDFVLCVRGRFVALELKATGGSPRPLQDYILEKVKSAGGVRLVASPDNWQDVKDTLTEMDSQGELAWRLK
jgi:hypothetical protein